MKPDNRDLIRIINTYSDTILRIAYQHTGNMHDAEDLAQEVFIGLMQKDFSEFDCEYEKAYIIRATINRCHSFFRKKKQTDIVYLDEIYRNENEPIFTIEERSVLKEISSLPPKYRDVIYLHYFDGYTAKEIAKIMGTTTGTITSQLKRAREKLKHLLKEENYG